MALWRRGQRIKGRIVFEQQKHTLRRKPSAACAENGGMVRHATETIGSKRPAQDVGCRGCQPT
jgi:hypothetical protein